MGHRRFWASSHYGERLWRFPICTDDPIWQLTAPIFPSVVMYLDKVRDLGVKFTIFADGLSEENIYIQSAQLNGKLSVVSRNCPDLIDS